MRPRRALRGLLALLGLTLLGLAAAFLATSGGGAALGALSQGERRARLEASPEWRGGHFQNLAPVGMMRGDQGAMVREWLRGRPDLSPTDPLPLFKDPAAALAAPPQSGLRLTWLGHSGVLLELDGVRVLTDPHWSERASPSTLAGPKRFHPPPLPLEQLGHLDAVLISHDHYDHLDMRTVQRLAAAGTRFLVPLGIGAHLRGWGVPEAQVTELDWWGEAALPGGVRAVAVPAQHFSGRFLLPNPTLWTSWALVGPRHRLFFSGDTGLHDQLGAIADRLGPFDVALLEIGQYHPAWGDIHLGAAGALQAWAALRAERLLPIHWATFALGLHGWSEPAEELVRLAGPRRERVLTPLLGEPVEPERYAPREPWWRGVR